MKNWADPKTGAFSNPATLVKMAELAMERLDQLEAEAGAEGRE